MRDNLSEPLDCTRGWRVLSKRNLSSYLIVQLDNITPCVYRKLDSARREGDLEAQYDSSELGCRTIRSRVIPLPDLHDRSSKYFNATEVFSDRYVIWYRCKGERSTWYEVQKMYLHRACWSSKT